MTDTCASPVRLGSDAGSVRKIESGWELRFERRLRHAPGRVWAALTTPEGLRGWLAAAEIEPRAGGSMVLTFEQPETEDFPCRDDVRRQSRVCPPAARITASACTRYRVPSFRSKPYAPNTAPSWVRIRVMYTPSSTGIRSCSARRTRVRWISRPV